MGLAEELNECANACGYKAKADYCKEARLRVKKLFHITVTVVIVIISIAKVVIIIYVCK